MRTSYRSRLRRLLFCCIKNKKKIKGISKIQHINIRAKKGAKKEPKKGAKPRGRWEAWKYDKGGRNEK